MADGAWETWPKDGGRLRAAALGVLEVARIEDPRALAGAEGATEACPAEAGRLPAAELGGLLEAQGENTRVLGGKARARGAKPRGLAVADGTWETWPNDGSRLRAAALGGLDTAREVDPRALAGAEGAPAPGSPCGTCATEAGALPNCLAHLAEAVSRSTGVCTEVVGPQAPREESPRLLTRAEGEAEPKEAGLLDARGECPRLPAGAAGATEARSEVG